MSTHVANARSASKANSMEVRVIFLACFVPSLVHAVAMRLVRGRRSGQSVIREAKAAADSCVSFALMG